MPKTYRIERISLADGEVEITVPDAVTPLITPDGSAVIIVQEVNIQLSLNEAPEA